MSITSDFTVFFGKRIPFLQKGSILYDYEHKRFGVCLGLANFPLSTIQVCWEDVTLEFLSESQYKGSDSSIELLGLRIDDQSLNTICQAVELPLTGEDDVAQKEDWIHQVFSNLKVDLALMQQIFQKLDVRGI